MGKYGKYAHELNSCALKHKKLGNVLLSSWLASSANMFESRDRRVQKDMSNMCLGEYPDNSASKRVEFAHDWYKLEEYSPDSFQCI